jgi:hypothetical protein
VRCLPLSLEPIPAPKGPALKTTVLARAAAVTLAALALSACSAINPITTGDDYQASDGVHLEIGDDARAQNLLVMTTAQDAPAVLTGSIHNSGDEALVVTISFDGTIATEVTVEPNATAQLGTGAEATLVQGTSPAAPGTLAVVQVGTPETGPLSVDVPVVDGTIPPYQDVIDTIPALPSAEPAA